MSWDAIVVGSGFGGAVTAARLSEKGLRVLVLERGPWWGGGGEGQPPENRRAFPHGLQGAPRLLRNVRFALTENGRELMVRPDGWYEMHLFNRLLVLGGSAVGGGSLAYTSVLQEPGADFWKGFVPEITAREMAPYFKKVKALINPQPFPHGHDLPEKNRLFAQAGAACGLGEPERVPVAVAWGKDPHHGEKIINAAGVAQGTCTQRGMCLMGCPNRAKTTLDLTYLPLAICAGAKVEPLCEVTGIGQEGKHYEVRFTDHRTGKKRKARAPRLVLAAGTLNTLRLLFQARDTDSTLPGLPPALGKNLSPNGDMGAVVLGSRELKDSSRGTAFLAGYGPGKGARHDFTVGEVGLPLSALPLGAVLKPLLGSSALLLVMGRDKGTGTATFDGQFVHTDLDRRVGGGLFDETEAAAEKLASHYHPLLTWANFPGGKGARNIITTHLLGGASIGPNRQRGVVDHTGQVFGYPGLYVADASLYPHPPGLPPSLTIAALAERQAALMN